MSLSVWLVSLSIIPSSSIYVVANDRISFLFMAYILLCTHTHTHTHTQNIFFIHSSVDGRLCWFHILLVVVVQSLNHLQLFATSSTTEQQASLSFTISQNLLKFTYMVSMVPSNNLILCPSPPALNLSQHQGLFKWVSSSYQVAKVLQLQL